MKETPGEGLILRNKRPGKMKVSYNDEYSLIVNTRSVFFEVHHLKEERKESTWELIINQYSNMYTLSEKFEGVCTKNLTFL